MGSVTSRILAIVGLVLNQSGVRKTTFQDLRNAEQMHFARMRREATFVDGVKGYISLNTENTWQKFQPVFNSPKP